MKSYKQTAAGITRYYKDKEMTILHRENGPAILWANGDKDWYLNGALHRMDGPAIEWDDGSKEWWINDEFIFEIDGNGNITDRMR